MSGRKYPLEPLVKLRKQQVDGATEKLAQAIAERDAAERDRLLAEASRLRAEDEARGVRTAERDALERGALRAADLQRARAWEMGVDEQRTRLNQEVSAATRDAERALAQVDAARGELASREADAEVVEKDKAHFDDQRTRLDLAKEEEAAAEVASGVNRRRRDAQ